MKKKNEDGTDAPDEPEQEETEEEKKKFKPENFDWYEVGDQSRTFPQFFTEMNRCEIIKENTDAKELANVKKDFLQIHRELEEGQDKYYYVELVVS